MKIVFDYRPKKELIKYFALLLHLHTKNYLNKHKLPTPPKISKKTLQEFKRFLNEETGYYSPLAYLLFSKGLNKRESEKLNHILGKYEEIDKNYSKLIKRVESFKENLEQIKPEIKKLLNKAEKYTKVKFIPNQIVAIPIPYGAGGSSLSFKKNLYICFRAYKKSDIKKKYFVYLILHETLHLLNLLPPNSKISRRLDKKYKGHWLYGEFSNVINESFTRAIEYRIATKRKEINKKNSEFLKFGKTKLFFEQLRDDYEKNPKYKNIKQFGLEVIKNFLF